MTTLSSFHANYWGEKLEKGRSGKSVELDTKLETNKVKHEIENSLAKISESASSHSQSIAAGGARMMYEGILRAREDEQGELLNQLNTALNEISNQENPAEALTEAVRDENSTLSALIVEIEKYS